MYICWKTTTIKETNFSEGLKNINICVVFYGRQFFPYYNNYLTFILAICIYMISYFKPMYLLFESSDLKAY